MIDAEVILSRVLYVDGGLPGRKRVQPNRPGWSAVEFGAASDSYEANAVMGSPPLTDTDYNGRQDAAAPKIRRDAVAGRVLCGFMDGAFRFPTACAAIPHAAPVHSR